MTMKQQVATFFLIATFLTQTGLAGTYGDGLKTEDLLGGYLVGELALPGPFARFEAKFEAKGFTFRQAVPGSVTPKGFCVGEEYDISKGKFHGSMDCGGTTVEIEIDLADATREKLYSESGVLVEVESSILNPGQPAPFRVWKQDAPYFDD